MGKGSVKSALPLIFLPAPISAEALGWCAAETWGEPPPSVARTASIAIGMMRAMAKSSGGKSDACWESLPAASIAAAAASTAYDHAGMRGLATTMPLP